MTGIDGATETELVVASLDQNLRVSLARPRVQLTAEDALG